MGLLDKVLGRDWRTYFAKGEGWATEGEWGLALQEYRSALQRVKDDEARAQVEAAIAKAQGVLFGEAREKAATLLAAGKGEVARQAIALAERHAVGEEALSEVEALKKQARALDEVEEMGVAPLLDDAELPPGYDEWLILLGALEEEQAAHYESLGEAFRLGWMALHAGEVTEALAHLEAAAKTHADDGYVACEYGRALFAADKLSEAAEAMARADTLADDVIYIKLHRVEVLWALEDFATAEAVLQAAHDLDEEDRRVFRAIGEHALRSGDVDPGIEAVELMLEDAPNDIGLLRMAGALNQAKGNLEAALRYFEMVLKLRWQIDPETHELVFDPASALGAAQIYLAKERKLERAIDLFHAMLSVTRGEAAAMMHLGIAQAQRLKKRPDEERKSLEAALELMEASEEEKKAEIRARLTELTAG